MIANGKLGAERKMTNQFLTVFYTLIIIITLFGLSTQVTGQIDWQKLSVFRSFYLGGIIVIFSGTLLLALASMLSKNLKKYQAIQLSKLATKPRASLVMAGVSLLLASGAGATAIFAYPLLAQVSLIAADAVRVFGSWLAIFLAAMSWLVFCVSLDSRRTEVEFQNNVAYWLRAGVWACLPIVGTLILLGSLHAASPLAFRPFDGNAMFYWHQAKTFSQVGFGGGYYTAYEVPANASFTRFGPHGPVYPLIYGSLGAVFGWYAYSAIIYNHFLLTSAFLIFIRITRLPQDKLWMAGLSIGLFPPLLLYAGANEYESFQQSLAILLAAILWKLLKEGSAAKIQARLFFIAFGFFCAAARPTWVIMMVPLVFLCLPEMSIWKRLVGTIIGGGGMAFGAYRLWGYMASRYNRSLPLSGMKTTTETTSYLIAAWRATIDKNIEYLVSQSLFSIEVLVPLAAFSVLLFSIFMLAKKIWLILKTKISIEDQLPDLFEFSFHIFSLTVLAAFLLPFMQIGPFRGMRYLGVGLLVSIFFLIAQNRDKVVQIFIVLSLVGLPSLINNYSAFHVYSYNSTYEQSIFEELQTATEDHIIYQPSSNGWCNSLLLEDDQQPFMVIPAGIGIASKFEDDSTWRYQTPLQSRYLILDRNPPGDNWVWLTDTPFGGLYLNTLTECPPLPY